MDLAVSPSLCPPDAPLRFTVHHVRRGDEAGHVRVSGRVEQGSLRPGDQVAFVPSATSDGHSARPSGTVVSVERFRAALEAARAGEAAVVHIELREVDTSLRPQSTMILAEDMSVRSARAFCAQVQVCDGLAAPIEVGPAAGAAEETSSERESSEDEDGCTDERSKGFTAILRLAEFQCAVSRVDWARNRRGKVESPAVLQPGDMAQLQLETEEPVLVCEPQEACEWLRRVVLMRGRTVVMVGSITGLASAAGQN